MENHCDYSSVAFLSCVSYFGAKLNRKTKTFKKMPSAANHKIDKQVSPENAFPDLSFAMSLVRQNNTLLEHKIRNLEKRKVSWKIFNNILEPHFFQRMEPIVTKDPCFKKISICLFIINFQCFSPNWNPIEISKMPEKN